jgi:hypothetical protein
MGRSLPEPLEVLQSGMLRPKKSLLAVVGLAPRGPGLPPAARLGPGQACSFSPCQYRRVPYWYSSAHTPEAPMDAPRTATPIPGAPLTRDAPYSTSARALRKWSGERVRISRSADGSLEATFRFDGTTCSNMGRPLAFDYVVVLGPREEGYRIRSSSCRPAPGDTGHAFMCAYITDALVLMAALAADKPLLGRPLDEILTWPRAASTSGCHCDSESRAHKWVLALEAIHYTLAHADPGSPAPSG